MTEQAEIRSQLEIARRLVADYFEVTECEWQGRYHGEVLKCRNCADGPACRWLYEQDEPSAADAMPLEQLQARLWFAVGYLEGRMYEQDHRPNRCGCAVCSWTRHCYRLLHGRPGAPEPSYLLSVREH